jgi:hypothetical protein
LTNVNEYCIFLPWSLTFGLEKRFQKRTSPREYFLRKRAYLRRVFPLYSTLPECQQYEPFKTAEKTTDIEGVPIPIVGEAVAGSVRQSSGAPKTVDRCMEGAKAVIVRGDSMEVLARDGDIVLFNENLPVHSGDLVYVKIKDHGAYFKKFYDVGTPEYRGSTRGYTEAKRKLAGERIANELPIAFLPINIHEHLPILATRGEIEFMYKVVAIKFK